MIDAQPGKAATSITASVRFADPICILDSLEFGPRIDKFRFNLASCPTRANHGLSYSVFPPTTVITASISPISSIDTLK